MEYRITKNAKHDKWRVEERTNIGSSWTMVAVSEVYTTLTAAKRKRIELEDAADEWRWEPI